MSPELKTLIEVAMECVEDNREEYGPDDIPRWRDCGCGGPLTEKLADAIKAYKKSLS